MPTTIPLWTPGDPEPPQNVTVLVDTGAVTPLEYLVRHEDRPGVWSWELTTVATHPGGSWERISRSAAGPLREHRQSREARRRLAAQEAA